MTDTLVGWKKSYFSTENSIHYPENSIILNLEAPSWWPSILDILLETAKEEGFINDQEFRLALNNLGLLYWNLIPSLDNPSIEWEPGIGIDLGWEPAPYIRLSITVSSDAPPRLRLSNGNTMRGKSLDFTIENSYKIQNIFQEVFSLQRSK